MATPAERKYWLMTFDEYAQAFRKEAQTNNLSDIQIEKCLAYAEKISNNGCPIIYSGEHLAMLVGYRYEYIRKAIFATQAHYRSFEIGKRDGGRRVICEPLPSLKEIQYWILRNILYKLPVHPYAKAYIPGRKMKDNLRFHKKQKLVLTLDIHDFFGSIRRSSVKDIFSNIGYSSKLSNILSSLVCLNDTLPQGAPTSPCISNIFMYRFDERIADYCNCKKKDGVNIRYTRYADDMAFSGDYNPKEIIDVVTEALKPLNLSLNEKKTKIMTADKRQIVTGCVVNQKLQLPREVRDDIRKTVYFIKKYGLASHIEHEHISQRNYLKHLLGKVNYACHLNPSDNKMKEYKEILLGLM